SGNEPFHRWVICKISGAGYFDGDPRGVSRSVRHVAFSLSVASILDQSTKTGILAQLFEWRGMVDLEKIVTSLHRGLEGSERAVALVRLFIDQGSAELHSRILGSERNRLLDFRRGPLLISQRCQIRRRPGMKLW